MSEDLPAFRMRVVDWAPMTEKQDRLLHVLQRAAGPLSLTNLPDPIGPQTVQTMAERGYVKVTIELTDKGAAYTNPARGKFLRGGGYKKGPGE